MVDAVRVINDCVIVSSTLVGNQVLDVASYMRTVDCMFHDKDAFVFLLVETTECITETNFTVRKRKGGVRSVREYAQGAQWAQRVQRA